MDDIEHMLSEIAVDRSDPVNQMRAIKALTGIKIQEAVLPEPMTDGEIQARLGRLMSGAGISLTRLAFVDTFKFKRRASEVTRELEVIQKALLDRPQENYPLTVKAFYKRYPALKAKKIPPGYPRMASIERKREWLKNECIKLDMDRAAAEMAEIVEPLDKDAKTDGRKLIRETVLPGERPPLPPEHQETV